jgi:hypothetical protein
VLTPEELAVSKMTFKFEGGGAEVEADAKSLAQWLKALCMCSEVCRPHRLSTLR